MGGEFGVDLLVIGARPGSLGDWITKESNRSVTTAGIDSEEFILDVTRPGDIKSVLRGTRPKSIVVTAGVNRGSEIGERGYLTDMVASLNVNCTGVMNVLNEWLNWREGRVLGSFVAVSSNSAHIARRNSAAYCASKAALSMAIRCAGRELAGSPLVYGYELGLLAGTPMTKSTEARFGPAQSRMVGAESGLLPQEAAAVIVRNLERPFMGFNGTLLRLDAGEQ